MLKRAKAPGFSAPEHGIWPASQWNRIDPTRPTRKWDTAWRRLRDIAGLPGLRFHGLRHTIITELAELECGEVSEWLKEHAWKVQLTRRTKCYHLRRNLMIPQVA